MNNCNTICLYIQVALFQFKIPSSGKIYLDSSGVAVRPEVKSRELCYRFAVCIGKLKGSQAKFFFLKFTIKL